MTKLRERWAKIPRPLRAIANILLVILLIFLLWAARGYPLGSYEREYRRMERSQMLGPGTIVHKLAPLLPEGQVGNDYYGEYDFTIVSETAEGIIFFGANTYSDGEKNYTMTYQEKTGDISLAVPPTGWQGWGSQQWDLYLPIYVFHEYPDAVRAELDLTIESVWDINYASDYIQENHKEPYSLSYSLQSQHQTEDFFLFSIYVENIIDYAHSIEYLLRTDPEMTWKTMHGPNGDAPWLLSQLCNGGIYGNDEEGAVEATIRLYDEQDNLIAEKHLTIRTPAEEAHTQQEVQQNEN